MNIFKLIQKKLMNKDVKPSNQTNLVNYDTNSVFLPKVKDLSVSEQQLVKKYMSEIDLTNLESLITYSKEINNKLSLNTNLVIEYLSDLEKEINSIKLILSDVLGNLYEYKCTVDYEERYNISKYNIGELKINTNYLRYKVTSIGLPKEYKKD